MVNTITGVEGAERGSQDVYSIPDVRMEGDGDTK